MKEPSEPWRKLRRATFERARCNATESLRRVFHANLFASSFYLVGLLHLYFGGVPTQFTLITAAYIVSLTLPAVLVPLLLGAVLAINRIDATLALLEDCWPTSEQASSR